MLTWIVNFAYTVERREKAMAPHSSVLGDRTVGRKNNKARRRKGTYGGVRQG